MDSVLDLVSLDLMDLDGTAQRVHATLAEAQKFDFAGSNMKIWDVLDELLHSDHNLFDGRLSTETMTRTFAVKMVFPILTPQGIPLPVQQIDIVCLKLLQAFNDRLSNIVWIVADLATPFKGHMVSKFGGQEDLSKP